MFSHNDLVGFMGGSAHVISSDCLLLNRVILYVNRDFLLMLIFLQNGEMTPKNISYRDSCVETIYVFFPYIIFIQYVIMDLNNIGRVLTFSELTIQKAWRHVTR